MKVWSMATQLAVGKKAEKAFLEAYPDLHELDGLTGDFIGKTGRKIELKAESRTTKQTPNMFIERFRDEEEKDGGAWQAAAHGVHYLVYLFSDGFVYWMPVKELIKHLEANEASYKKSRIQNRGWSAVGWIVPRASLEHLIELKENIYERLEEAKAK